MHYAFLTTEFPTTLHGAGGLATYTRRMAGLLAGAGHAVEVFVLDSSRSDTVPLDGYIVHHVRHQPGKLMNLSGKMIRNLGAPGVVATQEMRSAARSMARALEARHALEPFDVVQSPDHFGLGRAVSRRAGRLHVVRCSAAMDLYMASDGTTTRQALAQIDAERSSVQAADLAIAPSRLVAQHYGRILHREVHVVRPPAYLEESPGAAPHWLPPRFLVHVAGWLGPRKGTDLIARALPAALREEPELVMLWFGTMPTDDAGRRLRTVPARNVLTAGPLTKPDLYAVMGAAVAAVLPSQVDNTPNTLIESLLLGTPVIISDGASQDELVSAGPGAALIPLNDAAALSTALVSAWRGNLGRAQTPWLDTEKGAPFLPQSALSAHLDLLRNAGLAC